MTRLMNNYRTEHSGQIYFILKIKNHACRVRR